LAEQQSDIEYFQDYTGQQNWAAGLHGYYKQHHQSRIRINYTYYNSYELFARIVQWYEKIDPGGILFDYSVIDDGSQIAPITNFIDDIPEQWDILRIDEDLGWNNEGAKNCLMRHTDNRWNLNLDSDWVITTNNLMRIFQVIHNLDPTVMYYPGNFGYGVGRNSYLITFEEYWKRGGYDQCFVGYHGNDYSMHRFGKEYNHSDFFRFARIAEDVMDPDDKDRLNEIKKFHNHMKMLEDAGYGYRNKEDLQDFVWTNEKERKKRWKNVEYQQVR